LSCAPDSREDIRQLVSGFGCVVRRHFLFVVMPADLTQLHLPPPFSEHAAFDNLWAVTVLTEFWRRLDEGQSPSLREIIDALGLEPFFD
jgi:hypothetical protein